MKVVKRIEPKSGRLIGIAEDRSVRFVELGDLVAAIKLPWTPLMAVARLDFINRRRFVKVSVLNTWVRDLESKAHTKPANELFALMSWVKALEI